MRLQTYETTATTITPTLPTRNFPLAAVVVSSIWERDHRLEEEGAEITLRTTTETLTTIDFNLAGLLSIRGQAFPLKNVTRYKKVRFRFSKFALKDMKMYCHYYK